jgi:hypothetical protein
VTGFFHCGDELAESPSLSGPLVTMTGSKSEGLADGVGAYMSLGPWRVHLLAGGREAELLPLPHSLVGSQMASREKSHCLLVLSLVM